MRPRAEAQARPVPQDLLRALYHRPDLRPVSHLRDSSNGRADPFQRVCHRKANPTADLGKPVSEFVVAAIAHLQIVSPGATQNQRAVSAEG